MKQNFGVPLSRNEMKNVMGGYVEGPCNGTDRQAHCTWDHGACVNQDWGACPQGSGSSCEVYCVDKNNHSYWP